MSRLYFAAKKIARRFRNIIPYTFRMKIKEHAVQKHIQRMPWINEKTDNGFPIGVNVIGSIKAEMGLGQSCRLVARHVQQSGLPFCVYNVDFDNKIGDADDTFTEYISKELKYRVNLFHVNPCELGNLVMTSPELWKGHYNIAFWLWELEEFPNEWVKYCDLFDEIWTPSDFAGIGVRKKTTIPVKTVRYALDVSCASAGRSYFGLPEDKFLYLIMYDKNSTRGRKNPQGAIEAYKKAFPEELSEVGIVIKINNATQNDVDILKKQLYGYKNVYFITDILKKQEVNALIKSVDVFVSLHRAEGFGLVMAEAMHLGTPVVTTNWSANTEFTSQEDSCMVDYTMVRNRKREGLYPKGCEWAEPSIEDAARYMVKLYTDKAYYQNISIRGKNKIEQELCFDKLQRIWEQQLANSMKS